MSIFWVETFERSFNIVGEPHPYIFCFLPASYIVDEKLGGLGFVQFLISVKPEWYISGSSFITEGGDPFYKLLLLYFDKDKNQLNRCHSYYIDEGDLKKKGGTRTQFQNYEIIASLLNHAKIFNERNCDSCRGENPLQTHFIQLLQKFPYSEES